MSKFMIKYTLGSEIKHTPYETFEIANVEAFNLLNNSATVKKVEIYQRMASLESRQEIVKTEDDNG